MALKLGKPVSTIEKEPTIEEVERSGEYPRNKRDGRPHIWLPDGSKRAYYSRPSSLAEMLDDKENLMSWRERMVLDGLHVRPELLEWYGDVVKDLHGDYDIREVKGEASVIVGKAKSAAGADIKADLGTVLHEFMEVIDFGGYPSFVPDMLEPCVEAYAKASTLAKERFGFKVLETELKVVNDDWRCAGEADKLMMWNGELVIGDGKTSQTMKYSKGKFVVQVAAYANGCRYLPQDALDGTNHYGLGVGREPFALNMDVSRKLAVIIHFPSSGRECHFIPIPIEHGEWGFELRESVREWRNFWNRKAQEFTPALSVEV